MAGKLTVALEMDQSTYRRVQSLIRTNMNYAGEVRKILQESANYLEIKVKKNAPVRSGALVGSIYQTLDSSAIPLWATVRSDAESTSAKGVSFRYGWALQASKKKFIYHYVSGRFTNFKTLNWWKKSRRGLAKKQEQWLSQMAGRIERKWQQ